MPLPIVSAVTRKERLVSLTQYYTATTLDGFIADPDNSLEWLFTRKQDEDGPMNYGAFIAQVGAMAMGATTYEWVLDHEFADKPPQQWKWLYDIPGWVFTHRQLQVAPGAPIGFTSAAVTEVHRQMAAAAGNRNIWIVGGGDLAGQFADAGLLDEVIVSIAPVTLGAGAPLLPRRIELRLDETDRNGDFVCARYAVVRAPG
jgi:dihydrofolate reductase